MIRARDLNAIYVTGPGHGGPGLVANTYLEGSYSEIYPHIGRDEEGLRRLFRQFSFPGGIPSHVAPQTPGSIHEGGELGYALLHAYGAALDNPDLLVVCVVGDGEAETGPLAASWHSNKFLNPAGDGAVLPILHLNGYKIANPTVLARITPDELRSLLEGYGYAPRYVEGDDPAAMHQLMAATLDEVVGEIAEIQRRAREDGVTTLPALADDRAAHAEGLDGPEGRRRPSKRGVVPFPSGPDRRHPHQAGAPRPAQDVDALLPPGGAVRRPTAPCVAEIAALAPEGDRRMSTNPHANGGLCCASSSSGFPGVCGRVPAAGTTRARRRECSASTCASRWATTTEVPHRRARRDRLESARRGARGDRPRSGGGAPRGDDIAPERPRHGGPERALLPRVARGLSADRSTRAVLDCYEAFAHIIDAMLNQHIKWLRVSHAIPWRQPIASLD